MRNEPVYRLRTQAKNERFSAGSQVGLWRTERALGDLLFWIGAIVLRNGASPPLAASAHSNPDLFFWVASHPATPINDPPSPSALFVYLSARPALAFLLVVQPAFPWKAPISPEYVICG